MNGKSFIWVVVAIIIIGGLVWWGTSNKGGVTSTGPVKIGVILPLTGDAASIGTVQEAAVEVAVDEINAAGGISGQHVQVDYQDGQCSAAPAVNAAQKLISTDHVLAIIGGTCSTETAAFGPLAMQNKVIVLSPSASAPNLSSTGKYFFRAYPSDAFQGKFGAEYAYNTLGARTVAVLYHISDYGTGIKNVFEQRFKELGGTIVDEEGTPQTTTDYRTELSKIKATNPALIYAPMYPDGVKAMVPQAKTLGITVPFFGADAWDDPTVAQAASGKGTFYYSIPKSDVPPDFTAKIKAKTSSDSVPVGVMNAYDEVKILAAAIAKVGTDPDKLADAIRTTSYDGVSGHIQFDQNGDLTAASYVVKKVANGTATVVQ